MDLVAGIPTGSIRVSFGYMSTREDIEKLITFVKDCFLEKREMVKPITTDRSTQSIAEVPVSLSSEIEGNIISTSTQVTVVSDGSYFTNVVLENIFLYPVKSCGCFMVSYYRTSYGCAWFIITKVSKWPICDKGLIYDREWMIMKPSGSCLTQKEQAKLCLIHPHLDLDKTTLTLTAAG